MVRCLTCDNEMPDKRAGARYCGSACRQAAYRARKPRRDTDPTEVRRHCLACELPIYMFESPHKVYCSDRCRKRYFRMRCHEVATEGGIPALREFLLSHGHRVRGAQPPGA